VVEEEDEDEDEDEEEEDDEEDEWGLVKINRLNRFQRI